MFQPAHPVSRGHGQRAQPTRAPSPNLSLNFTPGIKGTRGHSLPLTIHQFLISPCSCLFGHWWLCMPGDAVEHSGVVGSSELLLMLVFWGCLWLSTAACRR